MTGIYIMQSHYPYIDKTFDVARNELSLYYKMPSKDLSELILSPEAIENLLWDLSKEYKEPNLIHIANQYGAIHIWNLEHIQKIKTQMEKYHKLTESGKIKLLDLEIENWDLDKNSPDEVPLNQENFIKWLKEFINLCDKAISEKRNLMLIGD